MMADRESFSALVRQIWIDAVITEDGEINRASICQAFGIAIPQASLDLRRYQTANPQRLFYDNRSKVYRAVEGSSRQFSMWAHAAAFDIVKIVKDLQHG